MREYIIPKKKPREINLQRVKVADFLQDTNVIPETGFTSIIPQSMLELINRSSSVDGKQYQPLFSQYRDVNSIRAGTLEYGVYPVADPNADSDKKRQLYLKLENIRLNVDYFQNPN